MSTKVVFSGIQPTGIPHLGNYIGAIKQWVKLQNEPLSTRLLYSIVDLHALTNPQPGRLLRQQKKQMMATLLATGIDPKRCTLFYQSSVPEHSELMWILNCGASMGYLSRMTQWKSKIGNSTSDTSKLGLFSYPVLQAADILVHRATHVPVGDDQRQHLEFARECVTSFNHAYGDILIQPETLIAPLRRVMSLKSPHQKMSKSDPDPKSRVLLTDAPETIRQKIAAAVTDSNNSVSYDPLSRPGVSNLIEILSCFDKEAKSPQTLADSLKGQSLKDLKAIVAQTIIENLDGFRDRYEHYLEADGGRHLASIEESGGKAARQHAQETMKVVKEAIGIS